MLSVPLFIDDITNVFDRSRFGLDRYPIQAGEIDPSTMTELSPNASDVLIKSPRRAPEIPADFTGTWVGTFIDLCLAFEDVIMPDWRKTHYVHLTFNGPASEPRRPTEFGFGGTVGGRCDAELEVCHEYVVSSEAPIEYWTHAMEIDALGEDRDRWNAVFAAQIGTRLPTSEKGSLTVKPGEIMLLSGYQMRRFPVLPEGHAGRSHATLGFTVHYP